MPGWWLGVVAEWPWQEVRRGGSPEQPARSELSCSGGSGLQRGTDAKIAFHGQAMALQLGPRQGLEASQVPVLGRVSGIGQQYLIRQGVDRPSGQDLEHLGRELGPGQGTAQR